MAILNIFEPGFRVIDGSLLNKIFNGITLVPSMKLTTVTTVNETVTGTQTVANNVQTSGGTNTVGYQALTAAGATQGTATQIVGGKAIITVALTASTKGVKLPVASTGLEVIVGNAATFGAFVYPSTNGKIGAASTNVHDTVLAVNKVNRYEAVNSTLWIVHRGA